MTKTKVAIAPCRTSDNALARPAIEVKNEQEGIAFAVQAEQTVLRGRVIQTAAARTTGAASPRVETAADYGPAPNAPSVQTLRSGDP